MLKSKPLYLWTMAFLSTLFFVLFIREFQRRISLEEALSKARADLADLNSTQVNPRISSQNKGITDSQNSEFQRTLNAKLTRSGHPALRPNPKIVVDAELTWLESLIPLSDDERERLRNKIALEIAQGRTPYTIDSTTGFNTEMGTESLSAIIGDQRYNDLQNMLAADQERKEKETFEERLLKISRIAALSPEQEIFMRKTLKEVDQELEDQSNPIRKKLDEILSSPKDSTHTLDYKRMAEIGALHQELSMQRKLLLIEKSKGILSTEELKRLSENTY